MKSICLSLFVVLSLPRAHHHYFIVCSPVTLSASPVLRDNADRGIYHCAHTECKNLVLIQASVEGKKCSNS